MCKESLEDEQKLYALKVFFEMGEYSKAVVWGRVGDISYVGKSEITVYLMLLFKCQMWVAAFQFLKSLDEDLLMYGTEIFINQMVEKDLVTYNQQYKFPFLSYKSEEQIDKIFELLDAEKYKVLFHLLRQDYAKACAAFTQIQPSRRPPDIQSIIESLIKSIPIHSAVQDIQLTLPSLDASFTQNDGLQDTSNLSFSANLPSISRSTPQSTSAIKPRRLEYQTPNS